MPKWVTTQVEDSAHNKLRTAASSKNMTLADYAANVLEQHAQKLDVKIHDKEE
jgi:hypothetical protein